jgi:tripartite-type tricarboxylate transporter receptor subunit TctC
MKSAVFLAVLVALGTVLSASADAQTYPSHPIKLIVPFVAGGPPDVIARVIGDQVGSRLHQSVVIENRPSAGATLGTNAVASAAPDGYTLLFATTTSLSITPALYKNIGYDPVKSFAPVAGVSIGPLVLVVHPTVPAKTVQEFVAYARANPSKLNYGSGVGSPPHIAWGLFKTVTGSKIVFVPYRGMTPAMTDLLSGQIQVMIDGVGPLLPHIRQERLRALAVTGGTRSAALPNVPTTIESGYPNYELSFWTGIVAPAGTSADVVATLNGAINASLKSPAVRDKLAKFNVEPNITSTQEFADFIATQARI